MKLRRFTRPQHRSELAGLGLSEGGRPGRVSADDQNPKLIG